MVTPQTAEKFLHTQTVGKTYFLKKVRYHNNFVSYDVVESEVNLGDAVEIEKPPDNWEHQRHQRYDCLDLEHKPSITSNNHYKQNNIRLTALFWNYPGEPVPER